MKRTFKELLVTKVNLTIWDLFHMLKFQTRNISNGGIEELWKVARQKCREFRADKLPIYLLWTDTTK